MQKEGLSLCTVLVLTKDSINQCERDKCYDHMDFYTYSTPASAPSKKGELRARVSRNKTWDPSLVLEPRGMAATDPTTAVVQKECLSSATDPFSARRKA